MIDDQHAVGTRGVVVPARADESALELRQHRVRGGVDDVDRLIGPVTKNIEADNGVDEADVKGLDFLSTRQRDNGGRREDFVGSQRKGRGSNCWSEGERKTGQQTTVAAHLLLPNYMLRSTGALIRLGCE